MKKHYTERGFQKLTFLDQNGAECSIQASSLATEDCLWVGLEDANPQILCSHAARNGLTPQDPHGWQPFEIPSDVLLSTRMHLNERQALELAKVLIGWLESKDLELPDSEKKAEGNSDG